MLPDFSERVLKVLSLPFVMRKKNLEEYPTCLKGICKPMAHELHAITGQTGIN